MGACQIHGASRTFMNLPHLSLRGSSTSHRAICQETMSRCNGVHVCEDMRAARSRTIKQNDKPLTSRINCLHHSRVLFVYFEWTSTCGLQVELC